MVEDKNYKHQNKPNRMSDAEIMVILILFHSGGFRCFKHYYKEYVCKYLAHLFPKFLKNIKGKLCADKGDIGQTLFKNLFRGIQLIGKHSKKCTFYTLRFGCSFAAVNTIKPQLL